MFRFLRPLRRYVALLLIAVMVVVPVADAFSCSLEVERSHSGSSASGHDASDDADTKQNDSASGHEVCTHNHCHHTTAALPAPHVLGSVAFDGDSLSPANDQNRLANRPDQLMRPPRI